MLTPLLLLFAAHAETDFTLEGAALAMTEGPATALGVRLQSGGGAFVAAEGRTALGEGWVGRTTAGLDLFPNSGFDFTLGAFLGGQGCLGEPEVWVSPAVGFELGLAVDLGPLNGRYRHINGGASWDSDFHPFSENEWRLSFQLPARVTVFGEVLNSLGENRNDNDDNQRIGAGLGASLVF